MKHATAVSTYLRDVCVNTRKNSALSTLRFAANVPTFPVHRYETEVGIGRGTGPWLSLANQVA